MSSLQNQINDTFPDANPDPPEPKAAAQPPLRSWRKKYRKLRLRFDKVMDDSNSLFKEEHRALALARRLQEENA
jgi:IEC3 subunit of the Ino80 complex, chromatin re-modelling